MAGSSRVFRGGIQELGEGRLGFQQLRDELRRVLEAVAVRVVDLLCVTVPTSAQRMSASRGRETGIWAITTMHAYLEERGELEEDISECRVVAWRAAG